MRLRVRLRVRLNSLLGEMRCVLAGRGGVRCRGFVHRHRTIHQRLQWTGEKPEHGKRGGQHPKRTASEGHHTGIAPNVGVNTSDQNDPGGDRTHDLRIKSPLLYRLSYRVADWCKLIGARHSVPCSQSAFRVHTTTYCVAVLLVPTRRSIA